MRVAQTFTLSARENMSGNTTVTVTVSDGTATTKASIVVTVTENAAPVITGLANQTIEPNMTRSVIFTVTDENIELGDTVTVSTTVTDSTILTVESVERVADTNSYLVAITAGATVGNTTLTVTARDSAGNSDTREVRVVVEERINANPRITQVLPESLSLLDEGPRNTTEVTVFVEDDVVGMVNIKMEEVGTGNLMISPSSQTVTIQARGEARQSDAFTIEAMSVAERTEVTVLITATDNETPPAATTETLVVTIVPNVAPVIAEVDEQVVQVDERALLEFTVTDANGNLAINSIAVTAADMGLIDIDDEVQSVEGEADTYSVVVTGLTAGMTTMTISASDDAGTEATPREVRVRVNAAPQINTIG